VRLDLKRVPYSELATLNQAVWGFAAPCNVVADGWLEVATAGNL
jgi:hypothetical protein